jgi:hypothetical protein
MLPFHALKDLFKILSVFGIFHKTDNVYVPIMYTLEESLK